MALSDMKAFHRPVLRAGVKGPDAEPLADWTNNWAEARQVLLNLGLATYIFGLLWIAPVATIEMETVYE